MVTNAKSVKTSPEVFYSALAEKSNDANGMKALASTMDASQAIFVMKKIIAERPGCSNPDIRLTHKTFLRRENIPAIETIAVKAGLTQAEASDLAEQYVTLNEKAEAAAPQLIQDIKDAESALYLKALMMSKNDPQKMMEIVKKMSPENCSYIFKKLTEDVAEGSTAESDQKMLENYFFRRDMFGVLQTIAEKSGQTPEEARVGAQQCVEHHAIALTNYLSRKAVALSETIDARNKAQDAAEKNIQAIIQADGETTQARKKAEETQEAYRKKELAIRNEMLNLIATTTPANARTILQTIVGEGIGKGDAATLTLQFNFLFRGFSQDVLAALARKMGRNSEAATAGAGKLVSEYRSYYVNANTTPVEVINYEWEWEFEQAQAEDLAKNVDS